MRWQRLGHSIGPAIVILLSVINARTGEVTIESLSVPRLVNLLAPACRLQVNETGKVQAIVSPSGESLNLATAAQDHPKPIKDVIGYWYSPSTDFLGRQHIKAARPDQAVAAIQLLHAIRHGADFVSQKIYQTRRFDGGWVVEVRHDFSRYPSSVPGIMPYELLVDAEDQIVQFRQRCYYYVGSATVYTNTVTSVYQREIRRNRGRDYPDVLREELRRAWEEEKERKASPKQDRIRESNDHP